MKKYCPILEKKFFFGKNEKKSLQSHLFFSHPAGLAETEFVYGQPDDQ